MHLHVWAWEAFKSVEAKTDILAHDDSVGRLLRRHLDLACSNEIWFSLEFVEVHRNIGDVVLFGEVAGHDLHEFFELLCVAGDESDGHFFVLLFPCGLLI